MSRSSPSRRKLGARLHLEGLPARSTASRAWAFISGSAEVLRKPDDDLSKKSVPAPCPNWARMALYAAIWPRPAAPRCCAREIEEAGRTARSERSPLQPVRKPAAPRSRQGSTPPAPAGSRRRGSHSGHQVRVLRGKGERGLPHDGLLLRGFHPSLAFAAISTSQASMLRFSKFTAERAARAAAGKSPIMRKSTGKLLVDARLHEGRQGVGTSRRGTAAHDLRSLARSGGPSAIPVTSLCSA